MAQGGEQISDAFQVTREQQVTLQIKGKASKIRLGRLEVTLRNQTLGSESLVCGLELDSPTAPVNFFGGFALRLAVGTYSWQSTVIASSADDFAGVNQEGVAALQNDGFGSEYGSMGEVQVFGTGNVFMLVSGVSGRFFSASCGFGLAAAPAGTIIGGRLFMKDLSSGLKLNSPFVLSTVLPDGKYEAPKTSINIFLRGNSVHRVWNEGNSPPAYPMKGLGFTVRG